MWDIENRCVKELSDYAEIIPSNRIKDYVWAITHTYIGNIGHSYQYSRTDFYANIASSYIPSMFEKFNSEMIEAFIETIKTSEAIKRLVITPSKLRRLRNLALKIEDKLTDSSYENLLVMLINETKEQEFLKALK